jgi:hypothetical protein
VAGAAWGTLVGGAATTGLPTSASGRFIALARGVEGAEQGAGAVATGLLLPLSMVLEQLLLGERSGAAGATGAGAKDVVGAVAGAAAGTSCTGVSLAMSLAPLVVVVVVVSAVSVVVLLLGACSMQAGVARTTGRSTRSPAARLARA